MPTGTEEPRPYETERTPAEARQPRRHRGVIVVAALVILAAAGLIVGLVANRSAQPAPGCGTPTIQQLQVTTPDAGGTRAVQPHDTINGDRGVTVAGKVSGMAGDCQVWLLDKTASGFYTTVVPSTAPSGFQFTDRPVGGENSTTDVTLTLVAADHDCGAALNAWFGGNGSGHSALPDHGCTALSGGSFPLTAERRPAG